MKNISIWFIVLFFAAHIMQAQQKNANSFSAGDIIAYCMGSPGSNLIYTINADGTGNARLINYPNALNETDYSHDGKYLIVNGLFGATLAIYKYDLSTHLLQQITTTPNVYDNHPNYSPDGSKIVFSRGYPPNWDRNELWLMNGDGTNAHYLGVDGYHAHFSPDGTRLAYSSNASGNDEIYICNINGTGVQRITNNTKYDSNPNWSPDGNKIVFDSDRDGNTDIYVMNIDGTQAQRLTNSAPYLAYSAEWSPDGTRIVFGKNLSGPPNGQIFVMNSDGSNVRQVTNIASPNWAQEPTWKPQPPTSIEIPGKEKIPADFKLEQNYPNPFNPSTTFRFELYKSSYVSLKVYDQLGRVIKIILEKEINTGTHSVAWDGRDNKGVLAASGMYYFALCSNTYHQIKKGILLK